MLLSNPNPNFVYSNPTLSIKVVLILNIFYPNPTTNLIVHYSLSNLTTNSNHNHEAPQDIGNKAFKIPKMKHFTIPKSKLPQTKNPQDTKMKHP